MIMTVSCWNEIVRIMTSSLASHKCIYFVCLTFILTNDFMCVFIHIGFDNVVLCYYKFYDNINTKLPTLKWPLCLPLLQSNNKELT